MRTQSAISTSGDPPRRSVERDGLSVLVVLGGVW